jgi:acyl dehydratase
LTFNLDALGRWTQLQVMPVAEEAIAAYARATDDEAALALGGRIAPPVFAIVPVWDVLQEAARAMAPEEARKQVVHGDQDILISAPIEAGMELHARAAAVGVHPKESGTTVILKTETRDGDGRLLNEQYVTEFYRGIVGDGGGGERAPDHRMPKELAETDPAAELTYPIADDITVRYAEASGDRNEIHLDQGFAKAAGLPGIIVHGLCMMAFAGRAVLASQGNRSPAAVRRLAVRFSRPVAPGDRLTTQIWNGHDGAVAFETVDGSGTTVLKDGLAELGDPGGGS